MFSINNSSFNHYATRPIIRDTPIVPERRTVDAEVAASILGCSMRELISLRAKKTIQLESMGLARDGGRSALRKLYYLDDVYEARRQLREYRTRELRGPKWEEIPRGYLRAGRPAQQSSARA